MTTKECDKCKQCLPLSRFPQYKRKTGVGHRSRCKACFAEYKRRHYEENKEKIAEHRRRHYEENKEKIAEHRRKHYEENKEKIAERNRKQYEETPEKFAERNRKWREENKEKVTEYSRKWREENKEKVTERCALRRARKKNAAQCWDREDVSKEVRDEVREKIDLLYILAAYLTDRTGVEWEVDHIVPLTPKKSKARYVQGAACGLHVPANLQVIPATENRGKNNKVYDDDIKLQAELIALWQSHMIKLFGNETTTDNTG